jgi:hypothetical protein
MIARNPPVKVGLTFGHAPERQTWSEAHEREMARERVARLKAAPVPKLYDEPRRSPVFILGAVVAVLALGAAFVTLDWRAVVGFLFGAFILTILCGTMWLNRGGKEMEEAVKPDSGENPFVSGRE